MKKAELSQKTQKLIAALAIAVFIILSAAVCRFIGKPMLEFAKRPDEFRAWVNSHGFGGRLAYMGMVIIQIIVAIIPGEPLELAGGYAFGAVEGTLLCLISSIAGSMMVFYLVRRFGIKLAEVFFSHEKLDSLRFLHESPKRDMILFVIFLIPGTPKDLLCYFTGITDIRPRMWLLICTVGRLPSIITSTVAGNAMGTQRYVFAVIVFAVTLILSGAGVLVYKAICKRHTKSGKHRSE